MTQPCELCGIEVADGEHFSWYLCNRYGVGVHLCELCAEACDRLATRAVNLLLRAGRLEKVLGYLLSASPARYVAALLDIGEKERAEDARQRYRVTHETVERMRKTGGHG